MYRDLQAHANASVLWWNGYNVLCLVRHMLSFNIIMLFGQWKRNVQLKCLQSTAHSSFKTFYVTHSTAKSTHCQMRQCRITINWKGESGRKWSWPILRCYSMIHVVQFWTCGGLPAAVNYSPRYKTRGQRDVHFRTANGSELQLNTFIARHHINYRDYKAMKKWSQSDLKCLPNTKQFGWPLYGCLVHYFDLPHHEPISEANARDCLPQHKDKFKEYGESISLQHETIETKY
jgi:hypothetical protein